MSARHIGAALLATAASAAVAGDGGFSYVMGIGRQEFRYQETSSRLPVTSEARSDSSLLVAGALYELHNGHLFSLDTESTFYPGQGSERWTSTSPVFNGITLTDPLLQSNGFSLRQTETRLLGHWRASDPWFVTGGFAMRSQSFKRYSFVVGPDHAVSLPAGATVEESTSEVLASIGMAYESGPLRGRENHYGARVAIGKPFWRRVDNTSQPQASFDGTGGWDFSLSGRYSFAVMRDVHLGAWGQWTVSEREGQSHGPSLELPRSRLDSLAIGIELLWKL